MSYVTLEESSLLDKRLCAGAIKPHRESQETALSIIAHGLCALFIHYFPSGGHEFNHAVLLF